MDDWISLNAFILKQKSKIPSGVSSNRMQEFPAKLFQQIIPSKSWRITLFILRNSQGFIFPSQSCYKELLIRFNDISHPYIISQYSIAYAYRNAYNILIYFESVIMQCITYIMTLHKANSVFLGKIRKQTNTINNF